MLGKMIKNIKIRKEEFGWIMCNLNDCSVYEISEIEKGILSKFNEKIKESEIIKSISSEFKKSEEEVEENLKKIKCIINH